MTVLRLPLTAWGKLERVAVNPAELPDITGNNFFL